MYHFVPLDTLSNIENQERGDLLEEHVSRHQIVDLYHTSVVELISMLDDRYLSQQKYIVFVSHSTIFRRLCQ